MRIRWRRKGWQQWRWAWVVVSSSIHDQIQKLRTKIRASRTFANEGMSDNIQHMKMLRANHDGLRKVTSIQARWTIRTLAQTTMASQQWECMWESQSLWL
jgi:hypothetical protein